MPKRNKSSAKNVQRIEIQVPSRAQIAELVDAAGLPQDAIEPFYEYVVNMAEAMRRMAFTEASPAARKQRLRQMGNVTKAMTSLADLVAEPSAAPFLSEHLSRELGRSLSTDAFERTGLVPDRLSIHAHQSYATRERNGPYRALEHEATQLRVIHAREHGARALQEVLSRLTDRVEAYLALERENKGGRPPDIHRRYVISRLALIYPHLYGTDPKPTVTGHFVQFCQLVMEALALPIDGLETAIQRKLSKRAKKRSA